MNRLVQFALAVGRLSQSVSATLDENHIVNLAVAQLVSEGLANSAILWLATHAGKLRVAAQRVTHEALAPAEPEVEIGRGRIGRVYSERRSIVTTQLRTSWGAVESESLRAAGVHSYAAFVLTAEEKPVGVLELFHTDTLTAEQTDLLSSFARHLALAIDHASEYQRAQADAGSARLIGSLNRALAESATPHAFAHRAAQTIGELRLGDAVVVDLWVGEQRSSCRSEYRASEQLPSLLAFAEEERHPPIAQYLLTTTAPVVIDSTAGSPNFMVQRLREEVHLTGLCCFPVVVDERVQGSVNLFRFEEGAFWRESEIQLAQRAAEQLSWALRAYDAAELGAAAQDPAEDFVRQIRHSLDAQSILSVAVQAISDHFEALRVYGLILPAGVDWLHPVPWNRIVSAESLRGGLSGLDLPFPIEGHLLLEAVTHSLEPVAVDDVSLTSYFPAPVRTRLDYLRVQSVLLAPIVFNNQVNGILVAHHEHPHRWRPQEVRWIRRLADQVAIAVKYVRLFEDAAEETLRMRTLVEILRLVMQPPSWTERLQAFVARVRRIFSADIVFAVELAHAEVERVPIAAESFHQNYPGPQARKLELPIRENPMVTRSLESPHAIAHHVLDFDGLPRPVSEFYRILEVRSQAAFTLVLKEDESLLVIVCACARDREWKEEELRLIEEVSGMLTLAHGQQGAAPPAESLPAAVRGAVRSDERLAVIESLKDQGREPLPPADEDEIREHLERANRNLEELVSIAAHDLQSPLVSIEGYVSRLEQELARGGEGKETQTAQPLERIRANIAQMQRLIRSLLDVSRLKGELTLDESVDTRSAVEKLRIELQPKLDSMGAELIVATELPVVSGSRVRIGQIFSNLVNNALNYRHPNRAPVIEIGCAARGADSEFYVRDNGIGIRPEDFDKIFKPLSRLKQVEVPGTGMGLYIVQRIVEKHGGHIWVDSREGAGATFYFTLPRRGAAGFP